ncbi:MAG: hypothetical protein WA253_05080, partial [Gammaproteobacteria bacterium]
GSAYSNGVNNLFANNASGTNIITPASIIASASAVILQASTDVTIADAITNMANALTISAGRSILINANISTTNDAITMTANDNTAQSVNRDAGAGSITMAAGTSLNSGTAALTLSIGSSTTAPYTPGDITLFGITSGVTSISSQNALTLNGALLSSNTIALNANQDGSGGEGFTLANGGSITTTNGTANAVRINVNAAGGGTGSAVLGGGNIQAANNATITVATNTGGNTTGGSITQNGNGLITFGNSNGVIVLSTPTASTSSIGTSLAPLLINSNATRVTQVTNTSGSGGVYLNSAGTGTLTLNAATFGASATPYNVVGLGLINIADDATTNGGDINFTGVGFTQANSTILDAGSGNITINARTGTLTMGSASLLLSAGTINTIANNIALNTSGTPSQIGGTGNNSGTSALVILQPSSAGRTIGIAGGAGNYALSANELNLARIRATNVTIGNSSSGLMTINAWTPVAALAANGTLSLTTGGAITQAGALNLLTNGASLVATAGGLISSNASITTSNQLVSLTGIGFTKAGATNINTGTGNLIINAGSGTLTLNATSLLLTGNAGGTAGLINLIANRMAFNATSQVGGTGSGTGSAQNVIVQPSTSGTSIGVAGGIGSLALPTTALNRIRATNVRIGNSAAGAITIGTVSSTWTPTATFATSLLSFDSANAITQSASSPINLGARALILRDSNNVLLTNTSNVFTNIAALLTGSMQLTSSNALTIASLTDDVGTLNGISAPGSNITLRSSSTIGESGSALVNAALLSTNSVGGTTLNNANTISSFNGTNTTSGQMSLINTGSLSLTGISQTGGNLVINNLGAISQTSALTVSGTSSFSADANTINLLSSGGGNSFTGSVALLNSGNNAVSLNNSIALILAASSVGNNLTITANGGISQIGILTVPGTSSFSAGANSIDLTQNNILTGAVSLNNSGNNNVSLTNSIALILGTSNVGAGTLSLISGGTMSEVGAITQAAGAGIVTLSSTVPTTLIDLSTAANNLSGAITIGGTLANIQDFKLRNINSSAAFPTNLGSLSNLRDLTLQFDNAAMIFPAVTLHNGGNLIAIAGGAITQSGILTIPGTASFNAGANAITLTQNNNFTGDVTLINNGNNNVSLTNAIALSLAASSVGSGTLNLTGAGVSQTGSITQAANAGIATINAGVGAINLANVSNSFTGPVSLNNSGNNNVALTNNASLILGTSSLGSGTLDIIANGTISQSGAINQAASAGVITLTENMINADILLGTQANNLTGNITFGGTVSNIHDFSLRNINASATLPTNFSSLSNLRNLTLQFDNAAMIFPAVTLHNGGNLIAIAGGAITQSGILTIPGTASFNAGANAITLTQNNNFTGNMALNNTGNNNITLTNAIALSLAASSVGSGTLTLNGLGISQAGAFIQAAGAGAATINAGAGAINLNNAGNNFTGSVSLNNSGNNNISLTNSLALA